MRPSSADASFQMGMPGELASSNKLLQMQIVTSPFCVELHSLRASTIVTTSWRCDGERDGYVRKTIDLFVSYATRDARELAEDIVADLELRGVTCWIAPRDIPAGARSWAAEIVASIRNCGSFLLLLSSGANASEEIEKEIDEAARQHKTLFAIRVEDIEPSAGLGYHLNCVQWRDLFRNRNSSSKKLPPASLRCARLARRNRRRPRGFNPPAATVPARRKREVLFASAMFCSAALQRSRLQEAHGFG